MKPTKNRVFCNNCHRVKMVFQTQEKAENFIKFNADNIAEKSRNVPVRSYFCPACGGWHVTHVQDSSEYTRTDEQKEKIYQLGVFVSNLKKNFDKKNWKVWKEALDKHRPWLEELQELPEQRLIVMEAVRQFKHYDKLVAGGEREELKVTNKLFNHIESQRKNLQAQLKKNLKDLKFSECEQLAKELKGLMDLPAFQLTKEKIKKECEDIVSCILDEERYSQIQQLVMDVEHIKGRANFYSIPELEEVMEDLENKFAGINEGLECKSYFQKLQSKIQKYQKLLQRRKKNEMNGANGEDGKGILDSHYETIRLYLIDAVTALLDKNNRLAVEYLTMADNRLKTIPFSGRKLEMLKYLTSVAENANLA